MRRLQSAIATHEPTRFATRDLPQSERLRGWARALEPICGMVQMDGGDDFEGRVDLRTIKNLLAARTIHNARSARHRRNDDARRNAHPLLVVYQLSGRSRIRQGTREASLLAGEMAMINSNAPCRLRFE